MKRLKNTNAIKSAVFITFPGNCKKALTFYQTCFGGTLHFDFFEKELPNHSQMIVSGSLLANSITIHGSDLVHDEGRKAGNYMAIFLACKGASERKQLIEKLSANRSYSALKNYGNQKLVELTDVFDVRWMLAIANERPNIL